MPWCSSSAIIIFYLFISVFAFSWCGSGYAKVWDVCSHPTGQWSNQGHDHGQNCCSKKVPLHLLLPSGCLTDGFRTQLITSASLHTWEIIKAVTGVSNLNYKWPGSDSCTELSLKDEIHAHFHGETFSGSAKKEICERNCRDRNCRDDGIERFGRHGGSFWMRGGSRRIDHPA